jgi:hypothetical protein
MVDSLMW